MLKVNLPNRPEGDAVVITGLGEFPNGTVSVVRDDVLQAYLAAGYTPIEEANWPLGVEAVQVDQEGLQAIFQAMTKKDKAEKAKANDAAAKKEGN